MVVRSVDDLTLVSAKEFVDLRTIDGGDTVVINLTGADGRSVSLLIPRTAVAEMMSALGDLPALCRASQPSPNM